MSENVRFEVRDVLLSSAILDKDDFVPFKLLNMTFRVNMEEVQDLKAHKWTTHEELAEMFGNAAKEAFLKYCQHGPKDDQEKLRIVSFIARPVTEKADEREFGWYNLKEDNENQKASNR